MPERFVVRRQEANQRLDKLLRQRFPALSFGQTQKLIRGGRVRVNGKRAKAADRIAQGVVVTLPYQGDAPVKSQAEGLTPLTLYEDAQVVVINKPAGLAVQGGSQVTSHVAGMIAGTDLRLVHRLDRDTSGLLLLGRGALAAASLTRAFAAQEVQKSYLALVAQVPAASGTLTLPLKKILQGGEGRMVVAAPEDAGAQTAETEFEVLSRSAEATLLRLSPKTGRTHQLRVHCAHAFGGIFGDSKYGQAQGRAASLCLHAWQVRLTHPETGEMLALEAPIPTAFASSLERFCLSPPQHWSPL